MDKKYLERRLEAAEKQMIGLQDEIQNLKSHLAEMRDEQEIPDFPTFKGSEAYFFCDAKLDVRRTAFPASRTNHVSMDFNAFRTSEYADEFASKCKLIAMMLHCKWHLCRDFKENFKDDKCKWYVYYANNTSHFAADYCVNDDHGSVYFDTEENAQKCADWLNSRKERKESNE